MNQRLLTGVLPKSRVLSLTPRFSEVGITPRGLRNRFNGLTVAKTVETVVSAPRLLITPLKRSVNDTDIVFGQNALTSFPTTLGKSFNFHAYKLCFFLTVPPSDDRESQWEEGY
jgi:hypothetical protein